MEMILYIPNLIMFINTDLSARSIILMEGNDCRNIHLFS